MGGLSQRVGYGVVAAVLLSLTVWAAPRSLVLATAMPEPVRDPSGLEIFYEEPNYEEVELRPELGNSLHLLELISQQNPDDFGFPATDGTVAILPVSTENGEAFWSSLASGAPEWSFHSGSKGIQDLEKRFLPSTSEVRLLLGNVQIERGGLSRTETLQVSNDIFDLASERHPGAGAWYVRIDPFTGRPILGVVEPTQGLIEDIVAAVGTDLIQLEVADPGGISQASGPRK